MHVQCWAIRCKRSIFSTLTRSSAILDRHVHEWEQARDIGKQKEGMVAAQSHGPCPLSARCRSPPGLNPAGPARLAIPSPRFRGPLQRLAASDQMQTAAPAAAQVQGALPALAAALLPAPAAPPAPKPADADDPVEEQVGVARALSAQLARRALHSRSPASA